MVQGSLISTLASSTLGLWPVTYCFYAAICHVLYAIKHVATTLILLVAASSLRTLGMTAPDLHY